ncbi:MAG: hypothetical protein AUI36_37560 [Cyanobacteria bacterium 13_1_40CM_2_61_4]|nr:MAG: hypothetical protein AUI36_37560 [Cyanobacteria bacterium 13_1_40CM_2_61_4]
MVSRGRFIDQLEVIPFWLWNTVLDCSDHSIFLGMSGEWSVEITWSLFSDVGALVPKSYSCHRW